MNARQWYNHADTEFAACTWAVQIPALSGAGTFNDHIQRIRRVSYGGWLLTVTEIEGIVASFEGGGNFTCDGTMYNASAMTTDEAAGCAGYMDDQISAFRRRFRREERDNRGTGGLSYERENSANHTRISVEDHPEIGSRVDEYRDKVDEIFRNVPETTGVYTNTLRQFSTLPNGWTADNWDLRSKTQVPALKYGGGPEVCGSLCGQTIPNQRD